jgi:hypothetical protein
MLGNKTYREAEQRIEQAQREGSRELDLKGVKMRELPEAIASLTHLHPTLRVEVLT